ncbi:hypothetical protein C4561_03665 [candidate division WWE3 bacterium]|jgi:hypothetical protein|uniref:Uncharacterized protein n=1 Tax=candidate division WWE3 bacterium TaxID=2053526 RepID=A0A3A4ZC56_UNCKA|nr:MAG: hypothetical protein C4561_03665 [candidate division WWE3 bacterium]
MKIRDFNRLFSILFFVLVLTFGSAPAYALTYNCANFDSQVAAGEAPSPLAIVCMIARLLNVAVLLVGLVFIFVVAYSAIKLSMALGDPKGFQGAQKTWTYALIGALVVAGFFALFMIIANLVGFGSILSPNFLLDRIELGLINFLDAAEITNYQN